MKKLIILLCSIAVLLTFTGCGNTDVKLKAEEIVSAFENSNVHEINELIFDYDSGTHTVDTNEEPEGSYSIIEYILPKVRISIKSVSENKVIFDIVSPNMTGVFDQYEGDISRLDSSELYRFITQYADKAETKSFTVELPVTKDSDNVKIDYKNKDFINAITGGLLDEYRSLYSSLLDQYSRGVE